MEAPEEVTMGSRDQSNIVKGKRTKRFRPQSPVPFAVVSSNSMFNGGGDDVNKDNYGEYLSLSSSSDEYQDSTTEEEEDMANCLILLAQGQSREPAPKLLQPDDHCHHHHQQKQQQQQNSGIVYEKFNSRRFMEAASNGTGKAGYYVYECKTCNRTFPSFQALGGHRASHKKPKVATAEQFTTTTIGLPEEEEGQRFMKTNNISSLSLQLSNANNNHNNNNRGLYGNNHNMKPNKVHECSICGSEFTSGQALGGHMRRHRGSIGSNSNITAASTALSLKVPAPMEQPKKPKNVLSLDLDLNLPAPDEDHRQPKFPFASKQQQQQQQAALVFSAPTLVDCHY
ncbi:hypothetical protein like AT5G04390 [Hibiscus trionum]|uniref:C2H2-type domain-containing protein n=1 Tax=Hibiscus trionum TaxID=183268 RepID=A0A9W7M607_HIBTR|nr:hypothetical protein like AT5G04390 [Hibiscus trionum]